MKKIELSGEQKLALTLPMKGAILIKGGAGSGKTLVSVKRAECLMAEHPDMFRRTNVAIFTYTNELVSAISSMVDSGIEVHGLDRWVYRFLGLGRGDFINDKDLKQYRTQAVKLVMRPHMLKRAIARKSDDFYCAEISWLKGRRIASLEQYKNTRRTGRGTEDRVTQQDRELLWNLLISYNEILAEHGVRDWDDRVLDALALVEQPGFSRPFSHIVIDEAQDFSFSRIQLIRGLVSEETSSITIVADTAQQIYQSGFSWADLGINVKGSRSIEFKRNYRNTRQISEAAYSLMKHEKDNADFTEMIPAVRDGAKPLVVTAAGEAAFDSLVRRIKEQGDYSNVVVAVPTRQLVYEYEAKLVKNGIPVSLSTRGSRHPHCGNSCVSLMTYHSLKGLQYEHVHLLDLTNRYFPPINAEGDEVSKARKLMYVAMTRACNDLTMYTMGCHSSFLDEIDPSLIVVEGE